MSDSNPQVFLLTPTVMHYPWGRRGSDSLVARLSGESDPSEPCAELWVGAHAKAPAIATLPGRTIPLDELLLEDGRRLLGETVCSRYGSTLPFLLKVLSIDNPLSIQAHPDKARAKVLHQRDPKNYPDANHKPEMALALSPVELLFGFYSEEELPGLLRRYPEIAAVVQGVGGQISPSAGDLALITFKAILSAPRALLRDQTETLLQRLVRCPQRSAPEEWFLRLSRDYPPGDIGLLCVLLLRYAVLSPGEAIFISPNTPHAYLSGELIECMANSDNVVRAGLTNKFCDVVTLLEMSDFTVRELARVRFKITATGAKQFLLGVEEFCLEELSVLERFTCQLEGFVPKVVFCLAGTAQVSADKGSSVEISPGHAVYIAADAIRPTLSGERCQLVMVSVPGRYSAV